MSDSQEVLNKKYRHWKGLFFKDHTGETFRQNASNYIDKEKAPEKMTRAKRI